MLQCNKNLMVEISGLIASTVKKTRLVNAAGSRTLRVDEKERLGS